MSLQGRSRIVEMPDYTADYPDMVEPAYILLEANGSGEFAFGCVTGQIWAGGTGDSIAFSWDSSDEMTEVNGDGWAELQPDGFLKGEICFHNGDDANFVAQRQPSSKAC